MAVERSSTMWKDAASRLELAKNALERRDYGTTIRESQAAIERIVKSLLEGLDVSYKKEHDVSRCIPAAYQKLRDRIPPEEAYHVSTTLARAAVLLRLLTSIKEYSDWSMKKMGVSGPELFNTAFARDLSKILLESVNTNYFNMMAIMGEHVWGPV